MATIIEISPEEFESIDFSEQDIETIPADRAVPEDPGDEGFLTNLAGEAIGLIDTGVALGTGLVAEVASGLGGLAKTITSGSEAGAESQRQIQAGLAFQPRSEAGQRNVAAIGEALDPVIKGLEATRSFLGDTAFEVTGSPGVAAAFSVIPDAALEVLGARAVLGATKGTAKNLGKVRKEAQKLKAQENLAVNKKLLIKSAPTPKKIFKFASDIYKEVDGMGASIKPQSYAAFADNIAELRTQLDIQLNPEISRLLDIVDDGRGKTLTVSQMDNIRKKTVTALSKSSKSGVDKFAAKQIQSSIDDLIGDADNINIPVGISPSDVSLRLTTARKLWSRGKRAQTVDEAIQRSLIDDNPLQNLKTSFKKLLKDDVRNKQFSVAEKKALQDFVTPGAGVNILRLAANFGIDFSRPGTLSNIFALAGGGAAGVAGAGPLGAGVLLAGGTVAKKTARVLLERQGDFANALFAAGRDANKIIKAYLQNVPKKDRVPGDLGQLLLSADKKTLDALPKTEFIGKAKAVVESRLRAQALAVPAPALGLETEEN